MLGRMVRALHHRGPDDHGIVTDGRVGLGFARLSILDLTLAGHQPMTDEFETCTISFNGEIFNFVEIREELERRGCRFRSRSDTEVALLAYREWGVECFRRFRGMWAIVIHDRRTGHVIASRDPFGIKPLYFMAIGAAHLFWASEIKALKTLGYRLSEDQRSSAAYIKYGLQDDGDWTFFREVWQLRPGEYAVIEAPDRIRRGWHFQLAPAAAAETPGSTEREQVDEVRRRLFDAIRISLRSDVPVWLLLSGGLDSSAIVSVARALDTSAKLNVLSVVHDDLEFNELEYAQTVAAEKQCQLEVVRIDDDECVASLEQIAFHQDEPSHSATTVNHWHLMKRLHQAGVRVVLSGQGVDEMLYGYVQLTMGYHFADLAASGDFAGLRREVASHWRLLHDEWGVSARRIVALMLKGGVDAERARRIKAYFLSGSGRLLSKDGRRVADEHRSSRFVQPFPDRLRSAMSRMMTTEYLPWILHYEDRNSMAFSIEERVPFLDRDLVSYIFALPARMKIRDGMSKWVLREALREVVPERVRTRRTKLGFNAPERRWLTSARFNEFATDLRLSEALQGSVVSPKADSRSRTEFLLGGGDPSLRWRVLSYALWRKQNHVI